MSESPDEPLLTSNEARVIGSLIEKQTTTPDYYPLTLNALVAACNQKNNRDPVMHLDAAQVAAAVSSLRTKGLVTARIESRAERYEHHLHRKLNLTLKERAIIAALLLRGPQTTGEIRANGGRMAELESPEEFQKIFNGLLERDEPLVVKLPRAPGQSTDRYAHLLCGMPVIEQQSHHAFASAPSASEQRIAALEQAVSELRAELDTLKAVINGDKAGS